MKKETAQRINFAMLAAVVAFIIVAVAGCAEIAAARAAIAKHGAEAADQTLESAIWAMCNGVPVGAIARRFKTAEERTAYSIICGHPAPPTVDVPDA